MNWDKLKERFPDTERGDWVHWGCGAWVHRDARIGPKANISDPCIIRSGVFNGGVFYGGVFEGGVFEGGTFYGGTFEGGLFNDGWFKGGLFEGGMFYDGWFEGGEFFGGEFHGGEFYGGTFFGGAYKCGTYKGGTFYGGVFNGGRFYSGVYRDGVFKGGEFEGGAFNGGVYHDTPFQLFGYIKFEVNVSGPDTVQIGCENHTINWWLEHWEEMAEEHEVDIEKAKKLVDMLREVEFPERGEEDKKEDEE